MPNNMMRKYVTAEPLVGAGQFKMYRPLEKIFKLQIAIIQNWLNGTSATTGLTVTILAGMGTLSTPGADPLTDPGIKWATLDSTTCDQPTQVQPVPGTGAGLVPELVTIFDIATAHYPEHLQIVIDNKDAVETCTLDIWGNE